MVLIKPGYEKTEPKKDFTFWDELQFLDEDDFKFSPYGSASIEIPEFFRNVMAEVAAKADVHGFQYTKRYGSGVFRQAAIDYFSEIAHLKGMNFEENVIVSLGANALTRNWTKTFIKKDDSEGLLFEPLYPGHYDGFKERGIPRTSVLKFNFEKGIFEFNWEDIEAQLNANTRLVVLCNPNNPSCRVPTDSEYQKLTAILDKYPDIKVIEDCAYAVYLTPGTKIRYFHEFGENFKKTVTVFSCGKIFNTTGNRLGFSFSHPSLTVQMKVTLFRENRPGAADQLIYASALQAALQPYLNYKNYWEYISADITHRIKYVRNILEKLGVKTYPCEGTYYLIIDALFLASKVSEKYYNKLGPDAVRESYRDRAVCRKLVLKYAVCLIPLSGPSIYSKSPYDQFLRIPCNRSYDELNYMLKAVQKVVDNQDVRI